MRLEDDLQNPRWMYAKAVLLLVAGAMSSLILLIELPSIRTAILLAIAIWSFARAYYFAFYVIEHYIDPRFKFAGIWSALRHLGDTTRSTPASRSRTAPDSNSSRSNSS